MTFFELLFYIIIIKPTIINGIQSLLEEIKVRDIQSDSFEIIKKREKNLINNIDLGSYLLIGSVIFIMTILLLLLKLLSKIIKISDQENFYPSGISLVITLIILINFQIIFYFFGKNFYYVGYYGEEEIIKIFYQVYTS